MIKAESIQQIGNSTIFIAIGLFIINPTLGLIVALLIAVNSGDDYQLNHKEIMLFLIITAAWISLINITKTISGDQGVYTRIFLRVPEAGFNGTVFKAWGGTGKEPAFSFLTWLLYWVTFGNVRLYYFILSFAMYILHYLATYHLFKKMDVPKGALICGVIVLTFFTQYFVMTLQIVRQTLAAAIVIYALVYRIEEGKNNWILLISAVLIHTSAAFLVILSLIPWFYSWMNKKRIIIVLGCFIPVITFNGVIGRMFGGSTGINALDYGMNMYGKGSYSDGGSLPISIMLIIFIPLIITSFRLLNEYCHYEEESDEEDESDSLIQILPVIYICLLLIIFILSFTKSPLIQYRFFYYSYSFIPLLLPLLFTKLPWNKPYWIISSLFFVIRFFLSHNKSGWTYAQVQDIIASSIYFYWTGNFHWMYLL